MTRVDKVGKDSSATWVDKVGSGHGDIEVDEGARQGRMKRLVDARLPSEEEVREHQLTRLPFRNWCPHCIRGRGKETNHGRQDRSESGLDEFHMDYCFPGDGFGFKLTILVVVEKCSA